MDLRHRLENLIFGSDDYLIDQQREVVSCGVNAVVVACPGSGKTRAVAARLALRIAGWSRSRAGIAALSFTNVAAEEIKRGLRNLCIASPGETPHFIGTIDSFVYQHITGPHASVLFPGATRRLELVLPHTEDWLRSSGGYTWSVRNAGRIIDQVPVSEFVLKPGGEYVWRRNWRQRQYPAPTYAEVKGLKDNLARRGFMSHSDSMYYAWELLTRYPYLAAGIAARYPEIVIDESQDTSAVQDAIISILADTGRTKVLLVGDPSQAIYEWNEADPRLMLNRVSEQHWHEIRLSRNYRSSSHICAAVNGFFPESLQMRASGRYAHCRLHPLLLRYPDARVGELPSVLAAAVRLIQGPCVFAENKIVARSNEGVRELRRLAGILQSRPNSATLSLISAAVSRDAGREAEATGNAEPVMCRLLFGRTSLGTARAVLGELPLRTWKNLLWRVVNALPPSTQALPDWIATARQAVRLELEGFPIQPLGNVSDLIRRPENCPTVPAESVVAAQSTDGSVVMETVHRVKGQNLDAIMLVASPRLRTNSRPSSAYRWTTNAPEEAEERRIAYVAMTRPRRLLVVALPESAWQDCAHHFPGFARATLDDLGVLENICVGCAID